MLHQGRKALFKKWLDDGKLACSEELGDVVRPTDIELALSIYLHANVPEKVVLCFAELGQPERIISYTKEAEYTPDYMDLLQHIVKTNPEKGVQLASQLANDKSGPLMDIERVSDLCRPDLHLPAKYLVFLDCGHLRVATYDPTRNVFLA